MHLPKHQFHITKNAKIDSINILNKMMPKRQSNPKFHNGWDQFIEQEDTKRGKASNWDAPDATHGPNIGRQTR